MKLTRRFFVVGLLFATAAYAADPLPADAPTAGGLDLELGDVPKPKTGLVSLEAGQVAPEKLSCLTDAEYIESEQGARADHEIAKAIRPGSGYTVLPTWGVVAMIAGALAAGAALTAAGVAVAQATKKP